MKRIFARIGMEMNVTDEVFEYLKKEYYDGKQDLTIKDANLFLQKGVLRVYEGEISDSYIPYSVFEEPITPEVITWDDIYNDATDSLNASNFFLNLKVKDTARAYVGGYALGKYGIDIENADCPEDAIEDFLKKHPECNRFNSKGQMVIKEVA